MTPNELKRRKNSVKRFLLYCWIKYLRVKRSHNHESSLVFAEVHATEAVFDVVAISLIIYLKVLIMLFSFITN